ncbi:hypothetical protein SAMN05518672_11569 [Chitinophaga sp. CF118]|uniref:hypothetical protein n=1 Tax=Chitinophaga sp. CF118 TaxID=1884367 RepID=UPI0008ECD40A|nr:hypothetical protein [Chitinophaga sp. CF118]SFF07257.1 hypothetical protein SAMN05518672_11569 [Chitinophaga sp. CF118]
MLNIFTVSYQELDSKIRDLSNRIGKAESFFGSTSKHDWDYTFELCTEINEIFKNVRYPSKNERDIAWANFFNLRNNAHVVRKEQTYNRSKNFYNEIMGRLDNADYHAISDFVVGHIMTFGLLKETVEDMKSKGKALGNIGGYFKSVKHEMTGEHKTDVHERMIEVRQHHDNFWGQHKNYQEEKTKLYEEKQRIWLEKQEKGRQIKAQIEGNLEKNIEKHNNAKDALERFEGKKNDLQSKIWESHSDNWKSKAEGWLDELNDKIRSVEDQIRRIEAWIDEDRNKLRNWR